MACRLRLDDGVHRRRPSATAGHGMFPDATRVYITIAATIVGLFLTGLGSALASGSGKTRPVARNIIVGMCSMAITYLIGHFVGTRV
ncbi:hypothetical protein JCM18909_2966 [Cutibacterium acnes JCM 18909]|nr:hypothetical protein JCM18909_2966 [Cutibacterium acnes JCM 18909]